MKKKMIAALIVAVFTCLSVGSCVGGRNSYALFNKVRAWNTSVSNKVVNELIFIAFWIIPVYPVCTLVDTLVLNSIEWWSGSNPMAMGPDESDVHYVSQGDSTIKIEVTQNRYNFEIVEGIGVGEKLDLVYNPETEIWSSNITGEEKELAKFLDANKVMLQTQSGKSVVLSTDATAEEYKAAILQ